MATVALRNAELVNEGRRLRADVLLRDGLIERIGTIPAGTSVDREIGRASCRERVCQYV